MMMIASLQRDFFTPSDVAFVESTARWIGIVAHRSELIESIERNAVEQGRREVAEELITVVAHDLRNYLSPVVLRLYTLRHRAEVDQRTDDLNDANIALSGLSTVSGLMSSLLDVARLDEGVFELQVEPIDIVALVKEAADVLSTPEHEIVVNAFESIIVAADPTRLRQCIDNLLANAITHSPKHAKVSVTIATQTTEDARWGLIEIVDEGPGIPEHILPHVFDRFVTGREDKGGSGLGLYIAKRIASAHKGDVAADRSPGKGARFTIRLPVYG
jgi:signal transduction histidine kinase